MYKGAREVKVYLTPHNSEDVEDEEVTIDHRYLSNLHASNLFRDR